MVSIERHEVLALHEDVMNKIKIVAEGHQLLYNMMETNIKELRQEIKENMAMLMASNKILRTEIGQANDGLRTELKAEMRNMKEEIIEKIDNISNKLYSHEIRIERLERNAALV